MRKCVCLLVFWIFLKCLKSFWPLIGIYVLLLSAVSWVFPVFSSEPEWMCILHMWDPKQKDYTGPFWRLVWFLLWARPWTLSLLSLTMWSLQQQHEEPLLPHRKSGSCPKSHYDWWQSWGSATAPSTAKAVLLLDTTLASPVARGQRWEMTQKAEDNWVFQRRGNGKRTWKGRASPSSSFRTSSKTWAHLPW